MAEDSRDREAQNVHADNRHIMVGFVEAECAIQTKSDFLVSMSQGISIPTSAIIGLSYLAAPVLDIVRCAPYARLIGSGILFPRGSACSGP